MTDAELIALAALVNAEIADMNAENTFRAHCGNSPAYAGGQFTQLDCVVCLNRELRRRNVVMDTTKGTKP